MLPWYWSCGLIHGRCIQIATVLTIVIITKIMSMNRSIAFAISFHESFHFSFSFCSLRLCAMSSRAGSLNEFSSGFLISATPFPSSSTIRIDVLSTLLLVTFFSFVLSTNLANFTRPSDGWSSAKWHLNTATVLTKLKAIRKKVIM